MDSGINPPLHVDLFSRVFIVAESEGMGDALRVGLSGDSRGRAGAQPADGLPFGGRRADKPRMGRTPHGIPSRLDCARWPAGYGAAQFGFEPPRTSGTVAFHTDRLFSLGNAVVPAQAYLLLAAVRERIGGINMNEAITPKPRGRPRGTTGNGRVKGASITTVSSGMSWSGSNHAWLRAAAARRGIAINKLVNEIVTAAAQARAHD